MNRTLRFVLPLTMLVLLLCPHRVPAPIIYRDGEGWNSSDLSDIEIKKNAEEQFKLAQRYEAQGDYKRAGASYRLVVRRFPRSDIAEEAQFRSGQMLEREGKLLRAFNEYQILVQRYPRSTEFEAALQAQYNIAKEYLNGKRVDVYGVPTLPSMTKAQEMFQKIVTNAPYSRIAPLAQYGVGQALEKIGAVAATVAAYQQVVDRYPNSDVAPNAMYQIGYVYFQASRVTGYDQTAAVRAQESFDDFLLRYPTSEKVPQAQDNLKTLQNRKTQNSYEIARFYDKEKNYKAAYVYYNEVLQQEPDSPDATRAKQRMDQIRSKVGEDALQIGAKGTATAQTAADRRKLQAQADTAGRPDFVGPPAPTPSPSPSSAAAPAPKPEQPAPEQKPMRTAPSDVTPAPVEPPPPLQPTPLEPAPAEPTPVQPAPVEPALPSQ
ncbi:MAG TPA: outer membrane protein assembly factor BamD [Chthoniobacterales bacterium]|nr:outer membrane protein assembly factor BamD [Chthoniobacterales bacterium]